MIAKLVAGFIPALLVCLFMYTGATKFFVLDAFRDSLFKQPFPHSISKILTWAVPILEVSTAVCLLFDQTRRAGLYLASTLLTLFTLYTAAISLNIFHKTPCSCAGIFTHLSWPQHFVINLLLTALALFHLNFITNKPT